MGWWLLCGVVVVCGGDAEGGEVGKGGNEREGAVDLAVRFLIRIWGWGVGLFGWLAGWGCEGWKPWERDVKGKGKGK